MSYLGEWERTLTMCSALDGLAIAFREVGLGNPSYPLPRSWRLANATAVPYTGRRSHGRYFRRPSGKRQALIEGARAVPPDAWDDLHFSHRFSKNWKRHRRTQWHDAV